MYCGFHTIIKKHNCSWAANHHIRVWRIMWHRTLE